MKDKVYRLTSITDNQNENPISIEFNLEDIEKLKLDCIDPLAMMINQIEKISENETINNIWTNEHSNLLIDYLNVIKKTEEFFNEQIKDTIEKILDKLYEQNVTNSYQRSKPEIFEFVILNVKKDLRETDLDMITNKNFDIAIYIKQLINKNIKLASETRHFQFDYIEK